MVDIVEVIPGQFALVKGGQSIHQGTFKSKLKAERARRKLLCRIKNGLTSRVKAITCGVRLSLPPSVKRWLTKHSGEEILNITLYREPVMGMVQKLVDLITNGKLSEWIAHSGYDTVFHTGLLLVTAKTSVMVHKEHVIKVSTMPKTGGERVPISFPQPITVKQFFEAAQTQMGDKFFTYDAFDNNCQVFIRALLSASQLLTDEADKFVFQDASDFKASSLAKGVLSTATNIAGRFDRLVHGDAVKGKVQHFRLPQVSTV